ncbi:MAG: type II toxin-antitoxin system ParD family antitoxin [Brevundimonas sp.]|uniref:ribbon-helix-helix domain-containing protein n=1 Tax=Brevundimonas sp. TaxID=1871086 RepID=UPI00271B6D6B|nr:type II toxin-antitoxin system ParD family antitoxin [Brevundimonas sp.]MDO9076461.1 type II toxin-antitoxin system ParD family antitoxin [Brevundimonas sp.]MDP3080675.1 type II toxin-antitoxin system ParD family antitoxin [Brevundimonas sp.]MDZ4062705.1 type II toxin-antitoxin system ParD family antitoxin [Brevundimonas sp.]
MTALKVTLVEPLDQFVQDQVASGAYPDADAVVSAGLRLLETGADDEAEKMRRFLSRVRTGLDQLDRGDGVEVTDLNAWFDALEAKALGR